MADKLSKLLVRLHVESIGSVQRTDGSVKIHYPASSINVKLDKRIERGMKKLGYSRWASGYDLLSGIRDLAFEMR